MSKKLFLLILNVVLITTYSKGQTWEPMGTNLVFKATCFAEYNGALYAGTRLSDEIKGIAKLEGNNWVNLGKGLGYNSKMSSHEVIVSSMAVYKDELYVGGFFGTAGGEKMTAIARWNGKEWHNVGELLIGYPHAVINDLAVYKDELYAGGNFVLRVDGKDVAYHIAKWDGKKWSPVYEGGFELPVFDLIVFNDELYAAGAFEGVWSTKSKKVITKLNGTGKWNGEKWTPISNEAANSYVKEMIAYKGELYSSKFKGTLVYDIDNMFPKRMNYNLGKYTFSIHKSDGTVWVPISAQPVAKGLTYLAVYKDALYVAAWVEKEGKGQCIMKWDGSTWKTIAKMEDLVLRDNAYSIQSMYVYNDELIVSGYFNKIDGKEIKFMAKYKE